MCEPMVCAFQRHGVSSYLRMRPCEARQGGRNIRRLGLLDSIWPRRHLWFDGTRRGDDSRPTDAGAVGEFNEASMAPKRRDSGSVGYLSLGFSWRFVRGVAKFAGCALEVARVLDGFRVVQRS